MDMSIFVTIGFTIAAVIGIIVLIFTARSRKKNTRN